MPKTNTLWRNWIHASDKCKSCERKLHIHLNIYEKQKKHWKQKAGFINKIYKRQESILNKLSETQGSQICLFKHSPKSTDVHSCLQEATRMSLHLVCHGHMIPINLCKQKAFAHVNVILLKLKVSSNKHQLPPLTCQQ